MNRKLFENVFACAAACIALGAGPSAFAKTYTVTVQGTITVGNVGSNMKGGSLFGLPAGTDLRGMPATLIFSIDDTQGDASETKLGATPYASQIVPKLAGITTLVTAEITLNGQGKTAGGLWAPEIYKPIVSRTLRFTGTQVTGTQVRIWTSEKSAPRYTAGSRALLDCGSPINAPFTTDYRWNASFKYAPPSTANCTASFNYYRASDKGWELALGTMKVESIDFGGEGPR